MNEDEPSEYEPNDDAIMAGALLIRFGAIDKAEHAIIRSNNLSIEEAQDIVAEAAMRLTTSAPRELRQSFEAILSYHRWNSIFEMAVAKRDTQVAMDAQKQLDKLMRSVH